MRAGEYDEWVKTNLLNRRSEEKRRVQACSQPLLFDHRRQANFLSLATEASRWFGISNASDGHRRPDPTDQFPASFSGVGLIPLKRSVLADSFEVLRCLLEKSLNGRIIGRDKRGEQLGHELSAAPLVAGKRNDGVSTLCQDGLALTQFKEYFGAHSFRERVQESAFDWDSAVTRSEFAAGGQAIDTPCSSADNFWLSEDMQREIFYVSIERIGDNEVCDECHITLMCRKRNTGCDFGADR